MQKCSHTYHDNIFQLWSILIIPVLMIEAVDLRLEHGNQCIDWVLTIKHSNTSTTLVIPPARSNTFAATTVFFNSEVYLTFLCYDLPGAI
mmetsp:Transcript_432/g.648  ORF Transcript_432/g.648 Transcript_432/m.648 type:complete len:90 (+) Transcript_432:398-667(+)